jgi:hypothetical protein
MNSIDKDLNNILNGKIDVNSLKVLTGGDKKTKKVEKPKKTKKVEKTSTKKPKMSREKKDPFSPREIKSSTYESKIKKREVNNEYIPASDEKKVIGKNTYEPYNIAAREPLKNSKMKKAEIEAERENDNM